MRRAVSILFLLLLLLQAVPVLHFFSSQKAVFYTVLDEEKPVEKPGLEKKAAKEYLSSAATFLLPVLLAKTSFLPFLLHPYSAPTLDALTPPPDAC